jgi:DNA-binding XRE family transcriptional regulator
MRESAHETPRLNGHPPAGLIPPRAAWDYPVHPGRGQLRAVRALLNWSRAQLAEEAGVSPKTIGRIERDGKEQVSLATVRSVMLALIEAGVKFVGGGANLRDDDN